MWNKKTLLLLIVAVFGVLALMSPALAKKYEGGDEGDGVDAQGYIGSICRPNGPCNLNDPGYICGLEKGGNIEGDEYACLSGDNKQAKISLLSYDFINSGTQTKLCYKVILKNLDCGKLIFDFFRNNIVVKDPKMYQLKGGSGEIDGGQITEGYETGEGPWKFPLDASCKPYTVWKACFTLDNRYRLRCGAVEVKATEINNNEPEESVVGPVDEVCGQVDCVEDIEQTDLTPAYLKYNGKKVAKVELYSSTNNQEWTYKVKTEKKNAEVRSIKICGFGDIVNTEGDNLGCSTKGNFKTNCKLGIVELKNGCVKFSAGPGEKIPDKFYIHIRTNEPYNVAENDNGNGLLCEVSGTAKIPVKQKPKPPKDCPQQCPCCPCFPCFPYFGMGGCCGGCGGQHGGCGGGNHGGCGGSHGGYEGRCGGDHEVGYSAYDVQGSYESGKSKRVLVDIKSKDGVSCPNSEDPCFPDGEIAVQV